MKQVRCHFVQKFKEKTCFLEKLIREGKNWAKFSSGTILPPNAPYSQLGPEKRYGAGFIKKFHPQTCFLGCTKLHSGTLLPPIAPSTPLAQENWWGETYYKNSNRKRVFWKNEFEGAFEAKLSKVFVRNNFAPNAPYSQLAPEKKNGAGFIKKFQPKTCFLGWTKRRSGTLLPPIAPSSPFGP